MTSDKIREIIDLIEDGPRHHYVLGHVTLRQICKENPLVFFEVMVSSRKDKFLEVIWQVVRKSCDSSGDPLFSIEDVDINTCRINNYPAIIVAMPPPTKPPEAYFVGIVLKVNELSESMPERSDFYYITLERGLDFSDGSEYTVLCEWIEKDGVVTHKQLAEDSSPVTQAAFIAAMEKIIRQRPGSLG